MVKPGDVVQVRKPPVTYSFNEADIRREGYEVVWKDWDKIFD